MENGYKLRLYFMKLDKSVKVQCFEAIETHQLLSNRVRLAKNGEKQRWKIKGKNSRSKNYTKHNLTEKLLEDFTQKRYFSGL